jgi:hypothetical protein
MPRVTTIAELIEDQRISTAELWALLNHPEMGVGRFVSTRRGEALVEIHSAGRPSLTVRAIDRL